MLVAFWRKTTGTGVFYLHAAAFNEQRVKPPGTKIAQPLHQHVGLMESLTLRNFIKQFEDEGARMTTIMSGHSLTAPAQSYEAAL